MKSITTLLMMCFITLTVTAQKTELIKGKWKYKDIIADKTKLDSTAIKQAKKGFGGMQMEFDPGGKFMYNMDVRFDNPYSLISGTWALNKEQTKVTTIGSSAAEPDKKKTREWEIKGLTATELKLNMPGLDLVIVLGRTKTDAEIRKEQIKEKLKKKQLKFSEGLAVVGINDNWGFIDATGKEVIPFIYNYAENFSGGLAKVRTGKYPKYKYGFIDKTGKEVIPVKFTNVGNFGEGLVPVNIEDEQGYRWGYYDKSGKEFIPMTYGGAWDFREGLAMVRNGKYGVGKCGFIDKTGKIVIPLKYDKGDEGFKEGLALVEYGGKYGFIDKTGNEIIPPKYDFAFSFHEGLAVVNIGSVGGKYGFVDKTGKEIIPLKYDNIANGGLNNGSVSVSLNKKWGLIDKTGKEIIPFKYSDAIYFREGLAAANLNDKWGFIDKTGKVIIPFKYNKTENFSDGLAAVSKGNKWGFINKTGKVIIPLIYDNVGVFINSSASVKLNGKYIHIDKIGKEVK